MQILFLFLILVAGAFAVYFSFKNNISMICYFMFMVIFQNIIVIIFCKAIPKGYYTIFSVIKELMLYAALFLAIIKRRRFTVKTKDRSECLAICVFVFLLTMNIFITDASISSAILSLRYMLIPILCIYVGRNLNINQRQSCKLFRIVVYASFFLAIFGLVELFLLGDEFWRLIGYNIYAVKMKGNYEWSLFNGVTINFYTWDFFGVPIRRLVSITADPLATSYLIYLGVMIIMTKVLPIKNKSRRMNANFLVLGILLLTSLLSLSKAVFVLMAITILACAYFFKWLPKSLLRVGTVIVSLFVILILRSYMSNATSVTSSLHHLLGLQSGFANAGLLGNGLGTAGASVAMLTGANSVTAESYIGVLVYQIGLIGFIAFMLFVYHQIINLVVLYKKYKSNLLVLSLALIVGISICMLFSESAVSIMGTGMYFLIIGIAQQERLYVKNGV